MYYIYASFYFQYNIYVNLNGEENDEQRQFDCFQIQCYEDVDTAAIDADELVKGGSLNKDHVNTFFILGRNLT